MHLDNANLLITLFQVCRFKFKSLSFDRNCCDFLLKQGVIFLLKQISRASLMPQGGVFRFVAGQILYALHLSMRVQIYEF